MWSPTQASGKENFESFVHYFFIFAFALQLKMYVCDKLETCIQTLKL